MTRLPNPRDLVELSKITHAREQAALARLAKLSFQLKDIERGIDELRQRRPQTSSISDAAAASKWAVWKEQEIKRQNALRANLAAIYQIEARKCGEAVAEHAVLSRLIEKSENWKKKQSEKRF